MYYTIFYYIKLLCFYVCKLYILIDLVLFLFFFFVSYLHRHFNVFYYVLTHISCMCLCIFCVSMTKPSSVFFLSYFRFTFHEIPTYVLLLQIHTIVQVLAHIIIYCCSSDNNNDNNMSSRIHQNYLQILGLDTVFVSHSLVS